MAGNKKIVKYHSGFNFDIGFFIFLIIIIYVLYHLFSYIITSPIAEYEVKQGTIATNNTYRGLILRNETIEYANTNGSVNYYVTNNSKVSVRDVVYSIDTTGKISDKINNAIQDGSNLNKASILELEEQITSFNNSYSASNFESVYSFKDRLASEINHTLGANALTVLSSEVSNGQSNNTFFTYKTDKPCIVSYYIDGYENISLDNFSEDNLTGFDYSKINLSDVQTVKTNDPIYKKINSENWNIIFAVSDSLVSQLGDQKYIKIRFPEDDFSMNVSFKIINKNGKNYINLKPKNAMIRYINSRFIDVELVLGNNSGLKIPISSITEKDFFTVPKEYFVKGGDSDNKGIMVNRQTEAGTDKVFVSPTIYYENDKYYFIDAEDVSEGEVITKADSMSTYTIGCEKDSLKGVYNINKGYAVFKQISILSQNDEYAIVETKTDYGLTLYDHIALDGRKITENQTVVK